QIVRASIHIFLTFVLASLFSCGWIGAKDGSRAQRTSPTATDGIQIKAVSYNIRYAADADVTTGNGWDIRKEPLAKLIRQHGFDIVGTQEGNFSQMGDLLALLPEYDYVGYPYA